MYTLRILEKNGVVSNHSLGTAYSRVRKNACKEFSKIMSKEYPGADTSQIDSLIVGLNGDKYFIYERGSSENNYYFIMTDSGQTFERL